MWDARLLGLLPAEVHTTSSFHLLGCVKKEIWDPLKAMVVDNFCNTWWHWCALVAIVNSDALHLSKPLPRCVKMENSKHVIEYIVIQYRKLQFGQLFLQKFDFFSFLGWPSTHCGKRRIFVQKFNFARRFLSINLNFHAKNLQFYHTIFQKFGLF